RCDHQTRQAGGQARPDQHRRGRDLQLPRWQGFHYRRCCFACPYARRMGRPLLILVDTHVVVWLAFDQNQISAKARAVIDEARGFRDGLAISDFTLLELAMLASKGRIHLGIASNPSFRKSKPALSSCRSVAVRVRALRNFQELIPKIQRIASSQPPRWSKAFL